MKCFGFCFTRSAFWVAIAARRLASGQAKPPLGGCRSRDAWSVSTQKMMVFWNRSPLCLRKSDTRAGDALRPLVDHQVLVEVLLVVVLVGDDGARDVRREVVEDLAPRRVKGGAAPVALVHHDEVEERRREVAEDLREAR